MAVQPPLRVLLVEDNPGDARLIQIHIEEAIKTYHVRLRVDEGNSAPQDGDIEVRHETTLHGAIELVKDRYPADAYDGQDGGGPDTAGYAPDLHLAILDLTLPDSHGMETIERFTAAHPHVPVLVLTGHDDETTGVRALKAGAQEYLTKNAVDSRTLGRAMHYALERGRLRGEIERARRQELESIKLHQESERLRQEDQFKGELLNLVSHELRTPLTPMKLQYYLLKRSAAARQDEQDKGALKILGRNLERLEQIVADVIDAMRIKDQVNFIHPGPADLVKTIAAAKDDIADLHHAKGVTVDLHLPDDAAGIFDAQRIRQCLRILLDNAVRYSSKGAHIEVRSTSEATNAAKEPYGGTFVVDVVDHGAGLSEQQRIDLFKPFERFHSPDEIAGKGTGLGLHIAKGIIAAHGGTIGCMSDGPGQGSTFWFRIPRDATALRGTGVARPKESSAITETALRTADRHGHAPNGTGPSSSQAAPMPGDRRAVLAKNAAPSKGDKGTDSAPKSRERNDADPAPKDSTKDPAIQAGVGPNGSPV